MWVFSVDFRKTIIKFHENPCSGSRVFFFMWIDKETDIMKLIVAFRNFTNTPKKPDVFSTQRVFTFHILLTTTVTSLNSTEQSVL